MRRLRLWAWYLSAPGLTAGPPPEEPAVIAQRGLQFYPAVLPISKGTGVAFPNEDNTYHNVFSYSSARRFDLGRYPKTEDPPVVIFDTAGEVRLFCEVHEHMRTFVLVLDTPYFTATDAGGHFILEAVPPGEYTLNIWRVGRDLEERPIRVGDDPLVID